MKPNRILLLVFLNLCCSSLAAQTTYTVGVEALDYKPLYYVDEKNQYSGFARELLDDFAKQMGIKFEYSALPIKRLYRGLLSADIDFKFPDNPLWQQDLKRGTPLYYSDPVLSYVDGVFVKPENEHISVAELKRLGVPLGFSPIPYQSYAQAGKISILEENTYATLIKLVLNNRLDGIYMNYHVAKSNSKQLFGNREAIAFAKQLPHVSGTMQLSSNKHQDWIQKFNIYMVENHQRVLELKEKHQVTLSCF